MHPIPELTTLDVVFPTKAMDILPPYDAIPPEFKASGFSSCNGEVRYMSHLPGVVINAKWLNVVNDWFFHGLKKAKWTPKPGVDKAKALAAVQACLGDWGPSQEHKEAGCAFLLSEWFDDVSYEKAK